MNDTATVIAASLIPAAPLVATLWVATICQLYRRPFSHRPVVIGLAISLICSLYLAAIVLPGTFAHSTASHDEHAPPVSAVAPGSPVVPLSKASEAPAGHGKPLVLEVYRWLSVGGLDVRVDLRFDAMTALMLVMVTSVSLLVAIFASSYMHGDGGYPRFFAEISLFVFSMCMLVLSGNFVQLFIFWEAVGVCSYLLIGFWYTRLSASAAAKKAFVVNRIGDFGLMTAIFLIYRTFGSVDFDTIFNNTARLSEIASANPGTITAICLLIVMGAIGKSAQFPLHVWLPDAMEGPTPVSALIHAATMVTAGVYLIARCTPLFVHSELAQLTVTGLGAATALIAAITALAQYDLKRILAYSTVSQIGYMFMALGAAAADETLAPAAVTFAMFHMFTHAFFKAVLFLSAGSVMHAMGDVIDMREFSGLRKALPITHLTFLCGALSLAGFPFLSGFWSKDEIIGVLASASRSTHHSGFFTIVLGVALLTALLTAFYTFRAYFLTFWGPERFPAAAGHHPHDAPPAMAIPLYLLAAGALLVGLIMGPTHIYAHYIAQTPYFPAPHDHPIDFLMMGVSIVIALVGIGAAYAVYGSDSRAVYAPGEQPGPFGVLSLKGLFLDELYAGLVVYPLKALSAFCDVFDRWVLDKIVDAVGLIPMIAGGVIRPLQNGLTSSYAAVMLAGVVIALITVLRAMAAG